MKKGENFFTFPHPTDEGASAEDRVCFAIYDFSHLVV